MWLVPKISVLFITYNRLITLRPTFEAFLANTDYPRDRLELICCDDGSPREVQAELRAMPFDVHCLPTKRRGLGANTNQGLHAATGDYILQLQDDWVCEGPADYLMRAIDSLASEAELGMLILFEHPSVLPVRRTVATRYGALRIYDNCVDRQVAVVGQHAYTDQPHIKRRMFHEQLGPYREGVPMWEMELEFSRRVNAQSSIFIGDLVGLNAFRNIGEAHSYNWPWKKRVQKALDGTATGRVILNSAKAVYRTARSLTQRKNGR